MLEYEEALERILAAVRPAVPERIPLAHAAGRILVERISAPLDLPLFDNSAMDGYAIRARDVQGATKELPKHLRLRGKVAAGDNFAGAIEPGDCVRVFTGSALPPGGDAVVMQEDTRVDRDAGTVSFLDGVKPWENIRFRGEDVKRGAIVGEAGVELTPGRVGLFAALGISELCVGKRPVTGLLASGSELREGGDSLPPGGIYESNRAGLTPLLVRAGAIPKTFPLIKDTAAQTREALAAAIAQCDIVITTGGVSVGELDFIKSAFVELGGEQEFWRVAIRPGRPFVFGRLHGKLLFGLPGNPVSAFVTFLLLVRPALLRWQGAIETGLPCQTGTLGESLSNLAERRHFARVRIGADGQIRSAGVQASHMLSSLANANALVDVPPNTTLPAGTVVQARRWE
jgi:molybdopterin molybdotransferase